MAVFLPGPGQVGLSFGDCGDQALHNAGGRLRSQIAGPGETYSVEYWFWNGLPNDARAVTGHIFSCGEDQAEGAPGDQLGLGAPIEIIARAS